MQQRVRQPFSLKQHHAHCLSAGRKQQSSRHATQRRVQVAGTEYDLAGACRGIDRLTGQVKMLRAVSEAYTAAERSADDVYHIALQDMSTQLQTTASDRAACQTAIIRLQECVRLFVVVLHIKLPCCDWM
jgi:hypothetical protein